MADVIYVPKSDILDLINETDDAGGFTDYSNYSNLWDAVDDMPAADVYPVNQWISVKDRLPEDNKPVLCFVIDTTGEGRTYVIGSCEHSEFWFLKIGDNKRFSFPYMQIKVTHWQPLPEPPKEGDTNV